METGAEFCKNIDFWCAFWYNYVDGKLIRQTAGFGTIDFIYGALGGLMEGAITPVREIAEKTGKTLSKVLTKVIRKTATEIVPSLLGGAISFYNRMQSADRVNKLKQQNKKKENLKRNNFLAM